MCVLGWDELRMCSWRVFVNMAVDGRQVKEAGMIEEATAAVVA
jgi:hypothetical protein